MSCIRLAKIEQALMRKQELLQNQWWGTSGLHQKNEPLYWTVHKDYVSTLVPLTPQHVKLKISVKLNQIPNKKTIASQFRFCFLSHQCFLHRPSVSTQRQSPIIRILLAFYPDITGYTLNMQICWMFPVILIFQLKCRKNPNNNQFNQPQTICLFQLDS